MYFCERHDHLRKDAFKCPICEYDKKTEKPAQRDIMETGIKIKEIIDRYSTTKMNGLIMVVEKDQPNIITRLLVL